MPAPTPARYAILDGRSDRRRAGVRRDEANRDAEEGFDRNVDCHADAAHRAAKHHAFAVQLDLPQMLVGPLIALATGIPALLMASRDLEKMQKCLRDPEGRRETELGRNKAIVGVVGAVLGLVLGVILLVEFPR